MTRAAGIIGARRYDVRKLVTFRHDGKKFVLAALPQRIRDVQELARKILMQEQDAHAKSFSAVYVSVRNGPRLVDRRRYRYSCLMA